MPDPLDATLLPARQFFRFSCDLREATQVKLSAAWELGEEFSLPHLAALEEGVRLADVRMGWNAAGLYWQVAVAGKTQPPWCRDSRLDESDGLQVWVDTRATFNIHRASRFCHRFIFLPAGGGGPKGEQPVADQLLLNRARENARPVRPRELTVRAKMSAGGYTLWAHASAAALGGFDPTQYPRLGFTYAVLDRERGLQTFAAGPEVPYEEDPSCWAELRLG